MGLLVAKAGAPSLPIADGIERAAQTFVDNDRMAASESM